MGTHVIKKGLDIPIAGAPEQKVHDGPAVARVAVVADDFPYMKGKLYVRVGDTVVRGQRLMEDRKSSGVFFTAPGAGTVVAVNRAERRRLVSIVIELDEGENPASAAFESYTGPGLEGDALRALLSESGLLTAFRTRPHSRVPSSDDICAAIFVTAIDTAPLAADPAVVLKGREADFQAGLTALTTLTEGTVYLCKAPGAAIPGGGGRVQVEEFKGGHPAGLAGTHIHMLSPVHRKKTVWTIGYQDVAALGHLVTTGQLDVTRVVAIGGPVVTKPRLVRTRLGASTDELTAGELKAGENRVVSGSIVGGRTAMGESEGFLGRYHQSVSCLAENRERLFMDMARPGLDRYSTIRAFLSSFVPGKKAWNLTTKAYSGHRAMVPIGAYERVMPLDILPTFFLRAILVDDLERAEKLGLLELDEDDVALCTFVSPGKEDYGTALRRNLTEIWKEG